MRLNGINITSTNNAGISVSHYAARGGNLDCLKYCINLGGGTKPNDLDIGLAHYAALGGCPQCVDYCLSLLPKKPDGTTTLPLSKEGATTTHYATMSGNIECIKHCIKKGVGSLDSKSNSEATCVHYAALGGCVDALKWCLAHEGGSGTDRDKMGLSLTHYAVFGSSVLALEYCLESEGGDIDVPSKGQGTPWNFIIKMGNPDILKFCEKKGILKSYEEKGLIKFNTLYKRYELVTTPKPTEVTPPSTNSVD
jgi:ankyrin repeat protein